MPAVRGPGSRASLACEPCRKAKARCHDHTGPRCLRCATLGKKCSFEDASNGLQHGQNYVTAPPGGDLEQKVARLSETVERLTRIVGLDNANTVASGRSRGRTSNSNVALPYSVSRESTDIENQAPLEMIKDAVAGSATIDRDADSGDAPWTIVQQEMLTEAYADSLLDVFQRNYGRWIAVDETTNITLNTESVKHPLLLCTGCLIAVRHSTNYERTLPLARAIFEEAKRLLSASLLQTDQPMEFFQAVLALSMWPTTAGQQPLNLDSWLITGFALQHASASTVMKTVVSRRPSGGYSSDSAICLWNHLCLSHLHACMSMRRKSSIGKAEIERAYDTVKNKRIDGFETRMIGELCLYWTIYEHTMTGRIHLKLAQEALKTWKEEWNFLFDMPRHHLLELSYMFGEVLMYEQALNNKSAAVRESVISEMLRLCDEILTLAMESADERTEYLTDHIYHIVAFASVTICRLLSKYEHQLGRHHDLKCYDSKVGSTIFWLHDMGSPSHICNWMGDIVAAVQRKLRPDAGQQTDRATPQDLEVPNILAVDSLEFDWDAMLPDWQSFTSSEIEPWGHIGPLK